MKLCGPAKSATAIELQLHKLTFQSQRDAHLTEISSDATMYRICWCFNFEVYPAYSKNDLIER